MGLSSNALLLLHPVVPLLQHALRKRVGANPQTTTDIAKRLIVAVFVDSLPLFVLQRL